METKLPYFAKVILIAMGAFALPVLVVAGTQWDSVKRFVIVQPEDAEGYVLFFDAFG